jgi:plasmid stabilization system protein ParE
MKILLKDTFLNRLEHQIDYIAQDSPSRARKFKNDLLGRIRDIPKNPYKHRKSMYFDDSEIRDLIFKGYTVVYRITVDGIEVFGFIKHQKEP